MDAHISSDWHNFLFNTSKVPGSFFGPQNINLPYLTPDVNLVHYMTLPLVLTSNGVNLSCEKTILHLLIKSCFFMSHVGFDCWDFWIGEAKGWTWGSVKEGALSWDICGRFYFLDVFSCLLLFWSWFVFNVSWWTGQHFTECCCWSTKADKRREGPVSWSKQSDDIYFTSKGGYTFLIIQFQFWSCCIWWDQCLLSVFNMLTRLIFCFLHQHRRMTCQNLLTHVTWRPV